MASSPCFSKALKFERVECSNFPQRRVYVKEIDFEKIGHHNFFSKYNANMQLWYLLTSWTFKHRGVLGGYVVLSWKHHHNINEKQMRSLYMY